MIDLQIRVCGATPPLQFSSEVRARGTLGAKLQECSHAGVMVRDRGDLHGATQTFAMLACEWGCVRMYIGGWVREASVNMPSTRKSSFEFRARVVRAKLRSCSGPETRSDS